MSTPYDNYLESEVFSAHPVKLVCLLYRGAIESVESARRHLREGDRLRRGRELAKASEILTELRSVLDYERGGDLSRNLGELYDYLQRRLNEAHIEQSDEPLAEAVRLLQVLLEGWKSCEALPASDSGTAGDEPIRLAVSY